MPRTDSTYYDSNTSSFYPDRVDTSTNRHSPISEQFKLFYPI